MFQLYCQGRYSEFSRPWMNAPHFATEWVDAPYLDESGWYCRYHADWLRWEDVAQERQDDAVFKIFCMGEY